MDIINVIFMLNPMATSETTIEDVVVCLLSVIIVGLSACLLLCVCLLALIACFFACLLSLLRSPLFIQLTD